MTAADRCAYGALGPGAHTIKVKTRRPVIRGGAAGLPQLRSSFPVIVSRVGAVSPATRGGSLPGFGIRPRGCQQLQGVSPFVAKHRHKICSTHFENLCLGGWAGKQCPARKNTDAQTGPGPDLSPGVSRRHKTPVERRALARRTAWRNQPRRSRNFQVGNGPRQRPETKGYEERNGRRFDRPAGRVGLAWYNAWQSLRFPSGGGRVFTVTRPLGG